MPRKKLKRVDKKRVARPAVRRPPRKTKKERGDQASSSSEANSSLTINSPEKPVRERSMSPARKIAVSNLLNETGLSSTPSPMQEPCLATRSKPRALNSPSDDERVTWALPPILKRSTSFTVGNVNENAAQTQATTQATQGNTMDKDAQEVATGITSMDPTTKRTRKQPERYTGTAGIVTEDAVLPEAIENKPLNAEDQELAAKLLSIATPMRRTRKQTQRYTDIQKEPNASGIPRKKSMFENVSRDTLQRYMMHYNIPKRQDLKKNLVKRVQKHFDEMDVSDIDLVELSNAVRARVRQEDLEKQMKKGGRPKK